MVVAAPFPLGDPVVSAYLHMQSQQTSVTAGKAGVGRKLHLGENIWLYSHRQMMGGSVLNSQASFLGN